MVYTHASEACARKSVKVQVLSPAPTILYHLSSIFCYYKNMAHFHEHVKRSLAKALTFRSIIIVSDMIIVYAVTHRYDLTIGVLIFSNISSTIIYFFHERMWNNIHWGRSQKKK